MRRSKVIRVRSANPPGLPGLCVEDEYGKGVVSSGATLVSPGAVATAVGCANSQYHAKAQQKADGEIPEARVPVVSLFFVFHNYGSLDSVANIFFFMNRHNFIVWPVVIQSVFRQEMTLNSFEF